MSFCHNVAEIISMGPQRRKVLISADGNVYVVKLDLFDTLYLMMQMLWYICLHCNTGVKQ